jgi:hypothetical protein
VHSQLHLNLATSYQYEDPLTLNHAIVVVLTSFRIKKQSFFQAKRVLIYAIFKIATMSFDEEIYITSRSRTPSVIEVTSQVVAQRKDVFGQLPDVIQEASVSTECG